MKPQTVFKISPSPNKEHQHVWYLCLYASGNGWTARWNKQRTNMNYTLGVDVKSRSMSPCYGIFLRTELTPAIIYNRYNGAIRLSIIRHKVWVDKHKTLRSSKERLDE